MNHSTFNKILKNQFRKTNFDGFNNKSNNLKIKKNLNERNLNSLSKEYFENEEQNYIKSPDNKTI